MIDARGIADEVNRRSGDRVTARMVREYVRLGIIAKALHPGRHGYDQRNVDSMLEARRLVREEGLPLDEVARRMEAARRSGPRRPALAGLSTIAMPSRRLWIGLGRHGRMAVELPERLPASSRALLVDAIERAVETLLRRGALEERAAEAAEGEEG